jgi:hypothetical protein
MRVLLDANVLLDCLVLEANGQPRLGNRACASDDAIKVDFRIKVKEHAIGMGNWSRA